MRVVTYVFLISFLVTTWVLLWIHTYVSVSHIVILSITTALLALCACYKKIRPFVRILCAVIFGITLSSMHVLRTTHVPSSLTVDTYATNQYVTLEGVIAEEPDTRPLKTKYTIAVHNITTASGTHLHPVNGRVLVTDHGQWPKYNYGDTVSVKGILEQPSQIETFAYDKYLSRYNIYSVIYRARISNIYGKSSLSMRKKLFVTKQYFESQLATLYGEPHASFMAGLLTGSRRGIPEQVMDDFNITGLTHIIAISGYNITIIISIISSLLFFLPFQWRLAPSMLAIAAFTIFVGANAAVVRAAIMGCLGLLALHSAKKANIRLSILWTLMIMLSINPKYLWYDAGFQLSFLAVIGLVELGHVLDRFFAKVPAVLSIRESLQMTIAAQLTAVPLIVFLFGRLSVISPIANMLAAPFIPLAMLFGFCGTIVSMIHFPSGQLLAFIGWGCLEVVLRSASILAKIPFASIETPSMNTGIILGYYVLLAAYVLWSTRTQDQT